MPVIMEGRKEKVFMNMNKYILLACFFLIFSSCRNDDGINANRDFFPPVQVYASINILFPQFADLNSPLGFAYIPEGYRGIVIHRTLDDRFVAFDRTCSFNTQNDCAFVSMDSSRMFLRCGQYDPDFKACCSSRFFADNGTVSGGDARIPLKQYFVQVQGTTLIITNSPM
jgi:hypothetical protein